MVICFCMLHCKWYTLQNMICIFLAQPLRLLHWLWFHTCMEYASIYAYGIWRRRPTQLLIDIGNSYSAVSRRPSLQLSVISKFDVCVILSANVLHITGSCLWQNTVQNEIALWTSIWKPFAVRGCKTLQAYQFCNLLQVVHSLPQHAKASIIKSECMVGLATSRLVSCPRSVRICQPQAKGMSPGPAVK